LLQLLLFLIGILAVAPDVASTYVKGEWGWTTLLIASAVIVPINGTWLVISAWRLAGPLPVSTEARVEGAKIAEADELNRAGLSRDL
jgi:hypothetical protein